MTQRLPRNDCMTNRVEVRGLRRKRNATTGSSGRSTRLSSHSHDSKQLECRLTEGIQEDKKAIRALEAEVEALHQSIDSGADGHENVIQTANEDKDNLMDERKLQWRREAQLDSEYTTAKKQPAGC